MKQIRIFAATVALTCIALLPSTVLAEDELDVTMEVFDDLADVDGTVSEMRGPDEGGHEDDLDEDEGDNPFEDGENSEDDFRDEEEDRDDFEHDDVDEEDQQDELESEDDFEDGEEVDHDEFDEEDHDYMDDEDEEEDDGSEEDGV